MTHEKMSVDLGDHAPFLDEDTNKNLNDVELEGSQALHNARRSRRLNYHKLVLVVQAVLLFVNVAIAASNWRFGRATTCRALYTPIESHIHQKIKIIADSPSAIAKSPFVSSNFEEADSAWSNLLRHHNLRIFEDEMEMMNITSIPFNHGGGYHGMMGVFHELHCLKLVREAVHQDHYYRNMSQGVKDYLAGHTSHCIDILRSSAMCRADTMIFPYHWSERNRVPNPTWVQKHECVDWNKLTEWLETRRVDIKALNMLVHPQYGPSYPGGKSIDEPNGPSWYPLDDET
ncbi:hypothetical protein HD806DRAFT_491739 [Xylariaceae sp. AK1471]|nr:hypothetical protein HD806DRAFT_491739 [Xylariaceae sp. AK1471]